MVNFSLYRNSYPTNFLDEYSIRIRQLGELHGQLCDAMDLTNKCYSFQVSAVPLNLCFYVFSIDELDILPFQIMMYIGSCFAFIILTFFSLYRLLVSLSETNLILSYLLLFWVFYFALLNMAVNTVASGVKSEVSARHPWNCKDEIKQFF